MKTSTSGKPILLLDLDDDLCRGRLIHAPTALDCAECPIGHSARCILHLLHEKPTADHQKDTPRE